MAPRRGSNMSSTPHLFPLLQHHYNSPRIEHQPLHTMNETCFLEMEEVDDDQIDDSEADSNHASGATSFSSRSSRSSSTNSISSAANSFDRQPKRQGRQHQEERSLPIIKQMQSWFDMMNLHGEDWFLGDDLRNLFSTMSPASSDATNPARTTPSTTHASTILEVRSDHTIFQSEIEKHPSSPPKRTRGREQTLTGQLHTFKNSQNNNNDDDSTNSSIRGIRELYLEEEKKDENDKFEHEGNESNRRSLQTTANRFLPHLRSLQERGDIMQKNRLSNLHGRHSGSHLRIGSQTSKKGIQGRTHQTRSFRSPNMVVISTR